MSRSLYILILLALIVASFLIYKNVGNRLDTIPFESTQSVLENKKTIGSDFENWHEFTDPEGRFKVLIPSLPQHATDKIVDPTTKEQHKFDMFVASKNDGTVFMISVITFPSKIEEKDYDNVLTNLVNDMLKRNKDNKLKMKGLSKFHDIKALDFAIDNRGITIGGKAFIQDNTLYVLSVIFRGEEFNQQEFDMFVNSFDIQK